MSGVKNLWGAGFVGNPPFQTPEQLKELWKVLKDGGIDTLDTATLYGESETHLSEAGVPKLFTLDTKAVGGFGEGGASKKRILEDGEKSFRLLGKVDVWYIHSPDENTPPEETLEAVNEMHKRGFFKRFGLSNFKPDLVQKFYDVAKAKGYPLPEVYQGNYNPAARKVEEDLIPLLRKLNISFYAYSPIAGGFLVKSKEEIQSGKGRFNPDTFLGQMYHSLYSKPELLEALAEWESIAKDEGVSRPELAYRWVRFNSVLKPEYGDAMIIGSSSLAQLEETLRITKNGPLSDKAVKRIDHFWETVKHVAPLDNFNK